MATTEDKLVIRQLEAARTHLLARGDADAVKSLDAIIDRLGEPEPAVEPAPKPVPATGDLLTEQEATHLLGIRSTARVWQWAEQGKLTVRMDGEQPRITRESVERLIGTASVQAQRRSEAKLAETLAPFDATDEDLAEIYDWYQAPAARDAGD